MIEWILAATAVNAEVQGLEMAREGARMAGKFSPVNTALLTVAIGLLGMILNYLYKNRKLTTEVNGELRQEFIAEMHALRDQVGGLRDDNDTLRSEVRNLRRENDQLRDEVRGLHGVIDGLRRGTMQAAMSAERVMASELPLSNAMQRAVATLDGLSNSTVLPVQGTARGNVEGDAKP